MSSRIRIDDLTLDTGQRAVVRGTKPIQLGPLTYKLLLALVEAAPEVATHDELANSVWDGRAVSPATISQRVKLLRDALSDDAASPRYIQVLHGQGYRLIPQVKVPMEASRKDHRITALLVLSAVLAAVASHSWFTAVPTKLPDTSNSIAVLPFVDMSPEHDQEYFADGVAEDILNLLAETTELRVIARTSSFSFRDQNADIGTIRDVLHVANVLEGSLQKSGNRVRISTQLVDTESGAGVWSATYERELGDILSLQSEIASSVASALKVKLSAPDISRKADFRTVNPQAFDLYLRGRKQLAVLSVPSLARASQYFEQSIELDPTFVQAYYALGIAYIWHVISAMVPEKDYRQKIHEVLDRGLALAPDHAGLIALSGVIARFEGDHGLAVERLRRALALNPSDVWISDMYAGMRLDQGYPRDALEEALRTYELDPLNWLPYTALVFSNIDLGNAGEALKAASRFSQIESAESVNGLGVSGFVRIQMQGDFVSGIRDWVSASQSKAWGAERSYMLAIAYYSVGDVQNGDTWYEKGRQEAPETTMNRAVRALRAIIDGDVPRAREYALDALMNPRQFTRYWGGVIAMRLAVDALIERGEASRAVELMLKLAPEWETYMSRSDIAPENFSPAPYRIKSAYSSYPALYFPDLVRALRASDKQVAAENMLGHLEAIVEWRRERGLLIEQFHVAEALALRDRPEAALNALERAEQDGTIYNYWQLRLLQNEVFEKIRDDSRFEALVLRVEAEMNRQRAELATRLPGHEGKDKLQ